MQRAGHLFDQALAWNNLREAAARALRGKRHRPDARRFASDLDVRLSSMRVELAAGTYLFGRCHQFVVHDPKQRIITAPDFRDRVVHHALINVCEPVFERWLIDDTYACRRGRGRIAAVLRARCFARRFGYYLKLDIRKYFDSIPHAELLRRLERLFKDPRLLDLFARLVGSFRGSVGRGLPIGALTSQHFANFYLGWFDREVKERWRVKGYARYMDDMVLWGDSAAGLRELRRRAIAFLSDELRLTVKPAHYLNRSQHGLDFLGCRVHPDRLTLNRRSRVRFRRKLAALESMRRRETITPSDLQRRGTALVAYARAAGVNSWQFRQRALRQMEVSGHEARTG
ncbi:MAG TPA: reverse transcriptase/maturase family protein [Pirellulales bacterium]|nr:reverse transcriptase/maturase family protein [Pirellulales bacterium]